MAKSHSVDVNLTLDFSLLDEQIKILREVRNKARGERRDKLEGILDLFMEIQEESLRELEYEDVYGRECERCGENFHDGFVVGGEMCCPKCKDKN